MAVQPPQDLADLGDKLDLGPVISVHRFGIEDLRPLVWMWLQLTGVSAAVLAAAWFSQSLFRHTALEGVEMIVAMAAYGGVLAFGFGGFVVLLVRLFASVWDKWTYRREIAVLFQNGVAVRQGGLLHAFPFSDISQIWTSRTFVGRGFGTRFLERYDLVHRDGRRITLEQFFTGLPACIAHIKRTVYPAVFLQAVSQFGEAKSISFGKLEIDPLFGVRCLQQSAKWEDIQSVTVGNGVLRIERRGEPAIEIDTDSIPNVEVAIQILQTTAQPAVPA